MKQLLPLLLLTLTLPMTAQQGRFEATVVDAQTQAVLPFASVLASQEAVSITNAEGTFSINCDSADVLRISYVGYKTAHVQAAQLHNIVALQPLTTQLGEVTVIPIGPVINKISKETLRLMRKYKYRKSNFFYRQTAFCDSTCYEFAESFLTGCPVVSLRGLQLQTGRYAALQSDSTNTYYMFGNFYTFSQIEVAANYSTPTRLDDIVPLFRHYDQFYDVSYSVISEDDNRIFVIRFEPKDTTSQRPILAATLFVDDKTMHIRRIVGEGHNFWIFHRRKLNAFRHQRGTMPITFRFQVDMSDEKAYPEVQSVYIDETHDIDGHAIATRSLLYNLGGDEQKKQRSLLGKITNFFSSQYKPGQKAKDLGFGSELHSVIARQGYDSEFWVKNEIVRRTPIEEKVMELFEQENLFGIMAPSQAETAEP